MVDVVGGGGDGSVGVYIIRVEVADGCSSNLSRVLWVVGSVGDKGLIAAI